MNFDRKIFGPHDARWKYVITTDAAQYTFLQDTRQPAKNVWMNFCENNAQSRLYPILGGHVEVYDTASKMFAGPDGFLVESGEIPSRAITHNGQAVPKFDQYVQTYPKV